MYKYTTNKAIIVIGIPIIVIAIWFIQPSNLTLPNNKTDTEKNRQVDYYLNTFTTRIFQKDGTLNYVLQGEQLNHYKNNNSIVIDHPILTYQDKETWVVSSMQATTTELLNRTITFTQNASVKNSGDQALLITADSLSFSPDTKHFIANSTNNENNVQISWKNGNITGSEIIANLIQEEFTLQNVQATYKTQ